MDRNIIINDLIKELKEEYVNGDIKITHLPMTVNPDRKLRKAIEEKYGKECPCCGRTEGIYIYTVLCCYDKKLKNHIWEFWKPAHYCEQLEYKCPYCNTRWKTPWFPQDLEKKVFEK